MAYRFHVSAIPFQWDRRPTRGPRVSIQRWRPNSPDELDLGVPEAHPRAPISDLEPVAGTLLAGRNAAFPLALPAVVLKVRRTVIAEGVGYAEVEISPENFCPAGRVE